MKKRLAVIGQGTVGCTAVAWFLKHIPDVQIDWYYDPKIKPTPVGEGTGLGVPLLWRDIDLFPSNQSMLDLQSTPKIGIHKRNWGNEGTEFLHPFSFGEAAVHFSGVTFQELAFRKLRNNPRVTFFERNVDPEEIDSDYVLVCTGTPKELNSDFFKADGIPVNAALVSQCPWDSATFDYSLTHAMPNGWIFGIPLRNRCSIGYVHNSDFIDRSQAEQEVSTILSELGLSPSTQNYFNFRNYYRKKNFSDRIVYCGNASFFLEPLEATSLSTSSLILMRATNLWFNKQYSIDQLNEWYIDWMGGVEQMISMHYTAGSVYNNDFWDYAISVGRNRLERAARENQVFINSLVNTYKYNKFPTVDSEIDRHFVPNGTWDTFNSFKVNTQGLGLESFIKELDSKYILNRSWY